MTSALWLPQPMPWNPPSHDDDVVIAIRALATGTANSAHQALVWRYLMYVTKASDEFQDLSFRPGGEEGRRATDFADGSRFVGMMIRKLLRPEFTPKSKIPEIPPTIQKRMRQRREKKIVAA